MRMRDHRLLLQHLSGSSAFKNGSKVKNTLMRYPNKERLEQLRSTYPAGTRIVLVQMDDAQVRKPIGNQGTVVGCG